MHRPRCGTENPDDAQKCRSCNCTLANPENGRPKPKAKTSKSIVGAVLLASLSLILSIFVKPTLAFLAAAFGLVIIVISIIQTVKRKKKLTARRIALGSFILLEMILLTYWRIDAAPIPNDYTIKDIRSAAQQYNHTYSLLKSLADKDENLPDAPAIGLSEDDVKNLDNISKIFKENNPETIPRQLFENEDIILLTWQHAKKGRDIFNQFDKYPEIADLSEPDFWDMSFPIKNFRRLVFLHRAYICLQSCKGNHKDAVDELIRMDSIIKKMNLNVRDMIIKLVCIACLRINIETANFIINNPQTPHESVSLLEKHFTPISDEHSSLRNQLIFQYLTFRNILIKFNREPRFRYSYFPPMKFNSTLRLYRNFCDRWISITENKTPIKELRVWPTLYVNFPVKMGLQNKLPLCYKIYNPFGSCYAHILTLNIEKIVEINTRLQIQSDLLQIVIKKRLGKDVDLKARAYSDQYIIDIENKIIFSPGPDSEAGTKDDIKLPINPEVLGLEK
jgi:hypothetical protein